MQLNNQTLTTKFNAAGIRDNVIPGVSVITAGVEAIGHGVFVDSKTLEQVQNCAMAKGGNTPVKEEHGSGFGAIVGSLKNFAVSGSKLVADLHLLKNHDRFSAIREMAINIPDAFGLSITFVPGAPEELAGKKYIRVAQLFSVDLVDLPAANPSGLFAAKSNPQNSMTSTPSRQQLAAIIAQHEPRTKIRPDWGNESVLLEAERVCFQRHEQHPWMRPESVLANEYWRPGQETARIVGEYSAITDPMKRTMFYRANKAAIDMCHYDFKNDSRNNH